MCQARLSERFTVNAAPFWRASTVNNRCLAKKPLETTTVYSILGTLIAWLVSLVDSDALS